MTGARRPFWLTKGLLAPATTSEHDGFADEALVFPIYTHSITIPTPGSIRFVINKATGTAMEISLADGKTVTGNPSNGLGNQRVR